MVETTLKNHNASPEQEADAPSATKHHHARSSFQPSRNEWRDVPHPPLSTTPRHAAGSPFAVSLAFILAIAIGISIPISLYQKHINAQRDTDLIAEVDTCVTSIHSSPFKSNYNGITTSNVAQLKGLSEDWISPDGVKDTYGNIIAISGFNNLRDKGIEFVFPRISRHTCNLLIKNISPTYLQSITVNGKLINDDDICPKKMNELSLRFD